jgi:hypothetical protein
MTTHTPQEQPGSSETPMTPAVLYVCAERTGSGSLAAERAEQEGRDFAAKRNLDITVMITDPFGEPAPRKRSGWMQVRELVENRKVGVVITRWPNAISPLVDLRHCEVTHCRDQATPVMYSWTPLATMTQDSR